MTNESRELLARIGTALYEPDALTRQDADALYDALDALVAEVERLRGERAAVVAYLRAGLRLHYANCIERGEHRREETR